MYVRVLMCTCCENQRNMYVMDIYSSIVSQTKYEHPHWHLTMMKPQDLIGEAHWSRGPSWPILNYLRNFLAPWLPKFSYSNIIGKMDSQAPFIAPGHLSMDVRIVWSSKMTNGKSHNGISSHCEWPSKGNYEVSLSLSLSDIFLDMIISYPTFSIKTLQ